MNDKILPAADGREVLHFESFWKSAGGKSSCEDTPNKKEACRLGYTMALWYSSRARPAAAVGEAAVAIKVIRSNWPPENYTMLREALGLAIAALSQPEQPTRTVEQGRAVAPGAMQAWDEANTDCSSGEGKT